MTTYRPRKKSIDSETLEMRRKLSLSLVGIFGFIIISLVSLSFFGPQIGSIFGFISINRNQQVPEAKATIAPPSFVALPKATKEKTLKLEGYSNSGSTVKLFVNGPEKGSVLTAADGKFVFDSVDLIDGRNTIFAKAVDEKGNESERSETHTITIDTKIPKVTITAPSNGETVKNLNERVLVKGEVSEKAKITVNGKLAVQRADQSFEYLLGVDDGDVEISVEAVDEAGNSSKEKIFIKYEKN